MKTTSLLCAAALGAAIFTIGYDRLAAAENSPSAPVSAASTPPLVSLDAQAAAQVKEQFETLWIKRGDLWYAVNSFGGPSSETPRELVEAKGLSFQVRPEPLTEADKLNELEWRGEVEVGASASRTRVLNSQGAWSDWKPGLALAANDPGIMLRTVTYTLEKKRGQWRIISSNCNSVRRATPDELDKAKL
jgi:hypothetical protein